MYRFFTGSLKRQYVPIHIADLPKYLRGIRLVQLSDFHYERWSLSKRLLTEAIEASNQANPDLIVLTGDYITHKSESIYRLVSELKFLKSRFGIYAVLGNHDVEQDCFKAAIIYALQSVGICVLWNEVVYPMGNEIALVGMAELWSGMFKPESVFRNIPTHIPRIVLSHNPDTAELMQNWRVDIQLSGHTHGGQFVIPRIGPAAIILKKIHQTIPNSLKRKIPYISDYYTVVKHWEWSQGLHQVGNNLLYVNRGLGSYLPGRFCCRPEITIFTLH